MGNAELTGTIFNIQKFSIHDGTGIRTLVFMKGCPLKCIWCSNPESQRYSKEIMFVRTNCTACGKCVELCPQCCIDSGSFAIDKKKCNLCGICTECCYANAKKVVGTEMTVYDVVSEIEKDRIFYFNSQGGVTIGGGEPTAQPEFVKALLTECKRLSLDTAIETCGFGEWDEIEKILSIPNQIFFDLKHMDSDLHKKYTGVDNKSILNNAVRIVESDKDVTFRIPLIPGYNDTETNIIETGKFIASLTNESNNVKAEVLPYHALGKDKYRWLDMDYCLNEVKVPSNMSVNQCNRMFIDLGCKIAT